MTTTHRDSYWYRKTWTGKVMCTGSGTGSETQRFVPGMKCVFGIRKVEKGLGEKTFFLEKKKQEIKISNFSYPTPWSLPPGGGSMNRESGAVRRIHHRGYLVAFPPEPVLAIFGSGTFVIRFRGGRCGINPDNPNPNIVG